MRHLLAPVLALLLACGGADAELAPLAPVTARVNAPLVVELAVLGDADGLTFAYVAPDLPSLRVSVSGSGGGGTFRWTPLASHVGTHEFTIQLRDGSRTVDEKPLIVTVQPADDAAPVFIRPGPGGTFDLTRDPCVDVAIEVRDDDSRSVDIRAGGTLPDGASITQLAEKSGVFEWCPSPDQVEAAERWTIPLAADDGDHPPTRLDYVVVLRAAAKPDCPGEPPVVVIDAPAEGATLSGSVGYEVRATVTDDMGLRDVPLLLYTTTAPDDPERPDITTFEQLLMAPSMGAWSARIPPLGLADGARRDVYFLVSATDNDDPTGTTCDNRTDSPLRRFTAVGGEGGALLPACEACASNAQCQSGLCATTSSGGRCVPACSGDGACASGTCGATPTVEGPVRAGCGPVDAVCGLGSSCTNDPHEPNDTLATATPYMSGASGQICRGDLDHWALNVSAGSRVDVVLSGFRHAEGDLDLRLLDGSGAIVASSASTRDREEVSHCFAAAQRVVARVEGFRDAENRYDLSMQATPDAGGCCTNDRFEPNDTRATARALTLSGGSASFEGVICPRDDDWFSFPVSGPSRVEVTLLIEDYLTQDLDLELRDPAGTLIGSSRGIGEEESIDVRVNASGTYTIRVFGLLGATSAYIGEVRVSADAGCTSSLDCPSDRICDGGSCVSRTCGAGAPSGAACVHSFGGIFAHSACSPSFQCCNGAWRDRGTCGACLCTETTGERGCQGSCPDAHLCPAAGPAAQPSECGATCTANSGCRSTETCKWFREGRYCGRRGAGANGDACATFADCGGQRACAPWPSGTCARLGCRTSADCEAGTHCIERAGLRICAKACPGIDDDCRTAEGYECDIVDDVAGELQLVCVPR
ncbi:MAG: PPC domain-containing protein [Myxococcales bacterium]|nr:PPC domain-containing protein [Myxococcales bacterium]